MLFLISQKIPDMLILVLYLLVLVFTPNYAIVSCVKKFRYHFSSYSIRGNYFFLHLEIQRSQYISPKVTVHKGAETIQGRKLFEGRNYMRKYGNWINVYGEWNGKMSGKEEVTVVEEVTLHIIKTWITWEFVTQNFKILANSCTSTNILLTPILDLEN